MAVTALSMQLCPCQQDDEHPRVALPQIFDEIEAAVFAEVYIQQEKRGFFARQLVVEFVSIRGAGNAISPRCEALFQKSEDSEIIVREKNESFSLAFHDPSTETIIFIRSIGYVFSLGASWSAKCTSNRKMAADGKRARAEMARASWQSDSGYHHRRRRIHRGENEL